MVLSSHFFLLGDGDFSFSRAIRPLLPTGVRVTATCLHPQDVIVQHYPAAAEALEELRKYPNQVSVTPLKSSK